jgi:bifunctional DNA-binding transcriptional regulator/antitoxin component of YhaV-PrlF toxin-antitoxin module
LGYTVIMTAVVKIEKNGKILLPVNVRRILNVQGGSDLLLRIDETKQSITMETRDQALARIRTRLAKYIPEGAMLSEELLADRRDEAARE